MTSRSLALDGQVAPEPARRIVPFGTAMRRVPDYWVDVDACIGRTSDGGTGFLRCTLADGHLGACQMESHVDAAERERYYAMELVEAARALVPLTIPATQVAPQITRTLVSDTPLMPDGTYTEFTFVHRDRDLPDAAPRVRESDLQIGLRVRVDCRPYRGPLVEGTIVSLSFDVRARKTLVRVRS